MYYTLQGRSALGCSTLLLITKQSTNQSAPKIRREITETEKITIGSISDEGKTTINAQYQMMKSVNLRV